MVRITGIGGLFFRAKDPKALAAWYQSALGIEAREGGYMMFEWYELEKPHRPAQTAFSIFGADTTYYDAPGTPPKAAPAAGTAQQWMANYRVKDLEAMLAQLRAAGALVEDKIDDSEYGRFAWATDPDGNRFELWQPPPEKAQGITPPPLG